MYRILGIVALFLLIQVENANAFVRTMSDAGRPLYWTSASPNVSVNPGNSSALSTNQVSQMLQSAFGTWNAASSAVSFNYAQSSNYSPSSGNDGLNTVYFSSQSNQKLDWGVIAVTEVLYYVSNGQIVEFDMEFNDDQFLFTANAGDTGQFGGGKTKIYLQDVAAHEMGHAYGLDHTNVNNSSMIYTSFSGQYVLGQDDKTGIQTMYPSVGGKGSIVGTVSGSNGGMFGVHVLAINQATGKVEAGTLAISDGTFRIGDLPPGQYVVMTEPFYPSTSSISYYWKNINHRFCGGTNFSRGFYSSCATTGSATTVGVSSGTSTDIGILSPKCAKMGNPGGAPTSIASAKSIASDGGAMFGTLNNSDTHYYSLPNVSGNLSVHVASYSIYSPVDVRVDILDANGNAVAGAISTDDVESPMPGGYTNYDASASVNNLSAGNYIIRVRSAAQKISSQNFSAGFDLLDSMGHYLLMVGVNNQYGTNSITSMSSCVSVNNTAQSATYTPPSASEEVTGPRGCGMITDINKNGGPPNGTFYNSSIFLILLTAFASRIAIILARMRSRR